MNDTVQALAPYGYVVLFVFVLAEQIGLPVPAVPVLLGAGALAAAGRMSLTLALGAALLASLPPDLVWYELGRRRGSRVLRLLCRISLEPDSCVRRTENLFTRRGRRALLIAKFLPGLSTVAPPLAGMDLEGARADDSAAAATPGERGDRVVDRRTVITGLAGGILAGPLVAAAQHAGKMPTIGVLRWGPTPTEQPVFRDALRELGYVEGQNVVFQWRSATSSNDNPSEQATELVRRPVNVIVAFATRAAHAARDATRTIPIVIVAADPVRSGLVRSLSRPGGNITGISNNNPGLAGKRLELFREAVPGAGGVAFLASRTGPATTLFVQETEAAAKRLGLQVQVVTVNGPAQFERAFETIVNARRAGVIVQPIFASHSPRIAELARKHRLPTISDFKELPEAGGLMSYGPNYLASVRRAAVYVDKILRGAQPADLPVEEPSVFEFVVNLKAAKALGLSRRVFIAAIGASVLAAPLAAEAQQPGKIYRIGMLETIAASLNAANLQAFRQELRALGYVEGQNLAIEYRSADGKAERFPELAAGLVRLQVDLVVTRGTPAAIAAKKATATIPIVMAASGDPIGAGLVPNLARPGGNVTGLSSVITELAGKRLELLREALPTFSRVALLWNPTNPTARNDWREADAAARALGIMPSSLEVRKSEDFGPAFDAARKHRADVMVVILDGLIQHHQRQIVDLARRHRLPDVYASREFVEAGGLMSYGVSYPDLYQRAAGYVDKILKGAKPADLPVEQPTKFELVINLKTAKALGLTIPPSLLLRADEIIQ